MRTILISGKSGSGKDAFASIVKTLLEEHRHVKVITIHFADLVKVYAQLYYNWNCIKDEAGRTLLQHLGTDTVRAKYPDYWARTVAQFLDAVRDDFDYALIPDARFPNEIETVARIAFPAISVRLTRYNLDGTLYTNPLFTPQQLAHPSETSLDGWKWFDYKYEIADGLTHLTAAATKFYDELIKGENI